MLSYIPYFHVYACDKLYCNVEIKAPAFHRGVQRTTYLHSLRHLHPDSNSNQTSALKTKCSAIYLITLLELCIKNVLTKRPNLNISTSTSKH